MNLILIGFRCSGKTTIGRLLAEKLGLDFVDVDDLVEENAGKSISELWEEHGESAFRAYESCAVADVSRMDNLVVALGGGAATRYRNLRCLRRKGTFILLEADNEAICSRMEADPSTKSRRPSLRGKQQPLRLAVEEETASRRSCYLSAADFVISTTGKLKEMVVDEVLSLLSTKGLWNIP
jgi:shikimate kinase